MEGLSRVQGGEEQTYPVHAPPPPLWEFLSPAPRNNKPVIYLWGIFDVA